MVLLRKTLYILLVLLLAMPLQAKKSVEPERQADSLSVEQQQQFTYYWYAAKQAIEQERYPDALALLEFCRMIKPNDGQTLTYLGIIYSSTGQKELAIQTFKQAFEADPRDQWFKYAFALLEQRTLASVKEAQNVMERALEAQKDNVDEDLLEQLRRLYLSTAQCAKAIEMQDRIDAIRGYDAYSAVNRYRTYALWNKPKKALEAIDKYLELEPMNVQFMLFRLEIMEHMGVKQSELYAMYERVLNLDPGNLMVLNNYAYHLATHKGDLKKAERMSAITIHEQPQNPVYLDTYGWILHLQGQDELALFFLQRALSNTTEEAKPEIEKHINAIK